MNLVYERSRWPFISRWWLIYGKKSDKATSRRQLGQLRRLGQLGLLSPLRLQNLKEPPLRSLLQESLGSIAHSKSLTASGGLAHSENLTVSVVLIVSVVSAVSATSHFYCQPFLFLMPQTACETFWRISSARDSSSAAVAAPSRRL